MNHTILVLGVLLVSTASSLLRAADLATTSVTSLPDGRASISIRNNNQTALSAFAVTSVGQVGSHFAASPEFYDSVVIRGQRALARAKCGHWCSVVPAQKTSMSCFEPQSSPTEPQPAILTGFRRSWPGEFVSVGSLIQYSKGCRMLCKMARHQEPWFNPLPSPEMLSAPRSKRWRKTISLPQRHSRTIRLRNSFENSCQNLRRRTCVS